MVASLAVVIDARGVGQQEDFAVAGLAAIRRIGGISVGNGGAGDDAAIVAVVTNWRGVGLPNAVAVRRRLRVRAEHLLVVDQRLGEGPLVRGDGPGSPDRVAGIDRHPGPVARIVAIGGGFGENFAVVVVGVHQEAQTALLLVVEAGDRAGLLARLRERGKEHRGQDGDNGDDDKQLNQCK